MQEKEYFVLFHKRFFLFGFTTKKNQQVEHKHKNNDQKQWRNSKNKTKKKTHENDA